MRNWHGDGGSGMNREILFKAKRTDNGEWAEGSLITGVFLRCGQDIPYILCPDKADYDCFEDFSEENGIFEVDPETVCQCTGLNDKNGKNGRKIWEYDIVRRTDLHDSKEPSVGVIEYDTENTSFLIHWTNVINYSATYPWKDKIEVIGNIFDNSELLEEVE